MENIDKGTHFIGTYLAMLYRIRVRSELFWEKPFQIATSVITRQSSVHLRAHMLAVVRVLAMKR